MKFFYTVLLSVFLIYNACYSGGFQLNGHSARAVGMGFSTLHGGCRFSGNLWFIHNCNSFSYFTIRRYEVTFLCKQQHYWLLTHLKEPFWFQEPRTGDWYSGNRNYMNYLPTPDPRVPNPFLTCNLAYVLVLIFFRVSNWVCRCHRQLPRRN